MNTLKLHIEQKMKTSKVKIESAKAMKESKSDDSSEEEADIIDCY